MTIMSLSDSENIVQTQKNSPAVKKRGDVCSDLNRNCPHKLIDLNAWSLASGTIRRSGLVGGGVTLLEEVCH